MNKKNHKFFGFTSDPIFAWVMKDPDTCARVIKAILPDLPKLEDMKIIEPENQHTIDLLSKEDYKSVRLDIFVRTDKYLFDLEMQQQDQHNLDNRSLFYGSSMVVEALTAGKDYDQLKSVYQIFLCCFDPFGTNKMIYSFPERIEKDDPNIRVKDGFNPIYVNAKGSKDKMSDDIIGLVDVMNGNYTNQNELAKLLTDRTYKANRIDKVWWSAMNMYDKMQAATKIATKEGMDKGVVQGENNMIAKAVKNLSKSYNSVSDITAHLNQLLDTKLSEQDVAKIIDSLDK